MPASLAYMRIERKPPVPGCASDPIDGTGYPACMDAGRIFARNLRSLMDYAADHGQTDRASPEGLEDLSGVSKSNIYRYLSLDVSPTIDKVAKIASAFDLQAWQLLVGTLDPSNPPVIPITEAERLLYKRIREVGEAFAKESSSEAAGPAAASTGPDRHSPRPRRRKPAAKGTAD